MSLILDEKNEKKRNPPTKGEEGGKPLMLTIWAVSLYKEEKEPRAPKRRDVLKLQFRCSSSKEAPPAKGEKGRKPLNGKQEHSAYFRVFLISRKEPNDTT